MNEDYTHEVVRVERAQTQNGKPMWRCNTLDGDSVNVFAPHGLRLFASAGYTFLSDMELGQIVNWSKHPIPVDLVKKGEYWDVSGVGPCDENSIPDVPYIPDKALYRKKAIAAAKMLLDMSRVSVVYFDTETTGVVVTKDDIVQFAAFSPDGFFDAGFECKQLIHPPNLEEYLQSQAVQVTGIRDFIGAKTFADAAPIIYRNLHDKIWVIYNAAFDTQILSNCFIRAGLIPPTPIGVHDPMKMFSEFYGEWQEKYQSFASKQLAFAYEHLLGKPMDDAHDALADVKATWAIVKAMAEQG